MAHKLLKLYSFLLYILTIITFFFIGISVADIVDAGKNQGLAGGAIVLGYAVIASIIGLILSLLVASKTNRKIIFRINIILGFSILGFIAYYQIRYQNRKEAKIKVQQNLELPKQRSTQISNAFDD